MITGSRTMLSGQTLRNQEHTWDSLATLHTRGRITITPETLPLRTFTAQHPSLIRRRQTGKGMEFLQHSRYSRPRRRKMMSSFTRTHSRLNGTAQRTNHSRHVGLVDCYGRPWTVRLQMMTLRVLMNSTGLSRKAQQSGSSPASEFGRRRVMALLGKRVPHRNSRIALLTLMM